MIEDQLEALAVDTRRQIYSMLLERPRSVREVADDLPVSRPAVSQHLKVLVEAGLARVEQTGTRRVYAADPEGIEQLREWADRLWSSALGGFSQFAASQQEEKAMQTEQMIEPLVKTVRLSMPPGEAFELFTGSLDEWWPLSSHSVGGDEAESARIEPFEGGRIYETTKAGATHDWGKVTEWVPGRRIAFDWHPGQPIDKATSIEVSFRQIVGGCEIILIHTGWESRGNQAVAVRGEYDTGWDLVLGQLTAFAL